MPSSVDAPVEKRRAVRIFHTSDWHLGRQTADVDRTEDFRSFLTWLLGQISERRPDVLLSATNYKNCSFVISGKHLKLQWIKGLKRLSFKPFFLSVEILQHAYKITKQNLL